MFTVSKLIWLGIILIAVWNFFRIVEKRQALKDRNDSNSDTADKKADRDSEPIAAVYCSTCATFTTGSGCDRADCGITD